MKKILFVTLFAASFASSHVVFADHHEGHAADGKGRPPMGAAKLTAEQQACVEKNLGKPGASTPPTREKFMEVAKLCNLPAPHRPGRPSGAATPPTTDATKTH